MTSSGPWKALRSLAILMAICASAHGLDIVDFPGDRRPLPVAPVVATFERGVGRAVGQPFCRSESRHVVVVRLEDPADLRVELARAIGLLRLWSGDGEKNGDGGKGTTRHALKLTSLPRVLR